MLHNNQEIQRDTYSFYTCQSHIWINTCHNMNGVSKIHFQNKRRGRQSETTFDAPHQNFDRTWTFGPIFSATVRECCQHIFRKIQHFVNGGDAGLLHTYGLRRRAYSLTELTSESETKMMKLGSLNALPTATVPVRVYVRRFPASPTEMTSAKCEKCPSWSSKDP